jgi:hypothetical protein
MDGFAAQLMRSWVYIPTKRNRRDLVTSYKKSVEQQPKPAQKKKPRSSLILCAQDILDVGWFYTLN